MMKKFAGMFVLFTALAAVSCSKDDDDAVVVTPPPAETANFVKFTAQGTDYNFGNPETIVSDATSISAFGGSTEPTFRHIVITVPNNATVGTHNVTNEPSNVNSYGIWYMTSDTTWFGTSGTINITSVANGHYEGTFTFTGTNVDATPTTVAVTNGSFKADKL